MEEQSQQCKNDGLLEKNGGVGQRKQRYKTHSKENAGKHMG